jgi:hypothetical protein
VQRLGVAIVELFLDRDALLLDEDLAPQRERGGQLAFAAHGPHVDAHPRRSA